MIDKEQINSRLLELDGKELEGDEAKEWARLIAMEEKILDKEDERKEKQERKNRKDLQNVPTDMEREATPL